MNKVLVKQIDPVKKAQFFSVFFARIPTYEEIKTRTENKALLTGIAELFKLGDPNNPGLVDHARGNWNYIFEDLVVLCKRLEEFNIEGVIENESYNSV